MESVSGAAAPIRGGLSPYNRVVWPDVLPWMDADRARTVPGVARALLLITGMIRQTSLDDYKGVEPLPRTRFLEQPDPARSFAWLFGQLVDDYLMHGNALVYISARDFYGYPAALRWLPAAWVAIECAQEDYARPKYWARGKEIPAADIVHVQRGADSWCPARGVGVVEQHMRTLSRAISEEEYEASALADGAVPSVAVIAPNPRLSEEEATAAKARWTDLFGGPRREPGVFPAGTQILPLSWSPSDAELTAARSATLVDIANAFSLDPYWLGAPSESLTYRSPGPMYLNLLRTTLEPIMTDFEQTWTAQLVPRGHSLRFDRQQLLADDMATTVTTLTQAVSGGLMTNEEARAYMGLSPTPADDLASTTDTSAPEPETVDTDQIEETEQS